MKQPDIAYYTFLKIELLSKSVKRKKKCENYAGEKRVKLSQVLTKLETAVKDFLIGTKETTLVIRKSDFLKFFSPSFKPLLVRT